MAGDSKATGLQIGWEVESHALRIYLAGEVLVESSERLLHQGLLPGPQGRHLLAFLAAEHHRAVGHDELAEELWDGSPPDAWMASLKALASRVRSAFAAAGFDGAALIVGAPGVYRFRLPERGWVDLDAARSATHNAETMLAARRIDDALGEAFVARLITDRGLLPGQTGPWLTRRRDELADLRLRALECSARGHLARGAASRAARDAQLALRVAPLREPSWRLLMDAHAAAGDIASALEAFARCQRTLRDALGVGPCAATRERHLALLAEAG
jgi:SARP family transcriptional regulator, regulator of embCAB operon